MQAAQIGIVGSSRTSTPPPSAMGWVKQAASQQEGTGWNWAKAIGANASEPAESHPAAKTTGTTLKPDDGRAADELAEAVVALPTVSKRSGTEAQKLALSVGKKLAGTAGDKASQASEAGKHKEDGISEDLTTTTKPAQNPADAVAIIPIPIPVAPAQLTAAPEPAQAVDEYKGKEKTGVVAAKRASMSAAKGTGDTKPVTVDSKAATASADVPQKIASVEEAKSRTTEAITVVPQAAAHIATNGSEASGAIALVEVSSATHKPAAAALQLPTEQKSVATTAAASETNTAHTIFAGPGQLEVGVLDGTHGWLSIRTEMGNNGAVNALLTSGATAHEGLRDSLPAMAGYLASEQLNVDRLAVGSTTESSFFGGSPPQSGYGSSRQQEGTETRPARINADDGLQDASAAVAGISAALFGGSATIFRSDGIGSWLSVTA